MKSETQKTLEELARVKAIFQQKTLVALLTEQPKGGS